MQQTEMAYRIGRSETLGSAAHARLNDQWEILTMLLQQQKQPPSKPPGMRLGIWLQVIGIVVTAAASIFGITLPDRVVHMLDALTKAAH